MKDLRGEPCECLIIVDNVTIRYVAVEAATVDVDPCAASLPGTFAFGAAGSDLWDAWTKIFMMHGLTSMLAASPVNCRRTF